MTLPDWFRAHLVDTGAANTDGVGTATRIARCRPCAAELLVGLDGDRAAMVVRVEPTEIDTAGELLALALGLRTYSLIRTTTGSGRPAWNLNPRDPWSIAAGRSRFPMMAQHRCRIAIPATTTPLIRERKRTQCDF